jgi:hypothetical protein
LQEKMETSFYTEVLSERIALFVVKEWDLDEAHTISTIAELFVIDIRLARYYLMKLVDKGLLCQITWEGNTYYAHRCWKRVFQNLGVKVL